MSCKNCNQIGLIDIYLNEYRELLDDIEKRTNFFSESKCQYGIQANSIDNFLLSLKRINDAKCFFEKKEKKWIEPREKPSFIK